MYPGTKVVSLDYGEMVVADCLLFLAPAPTVVSLSLRFLHLSHGWKV